LPGPEFVLLLGNEFEFAQRMFVAQDMQAMNVGKVSFEMVVDGEVEGMRRQPPGWIS
jgi:hypothetical protein